MSILKSNSANFKVSFQWLLDNGWEVYDFDIEQSPTLIHMVKQIPSMDGVHLNVYVGSGLSDNEIEKIVFIKRCCHGLITYKVLDIEDKKMMSYLFP